MRKTAKNFLAVLGGDVIRRFLGFLALVLLARRVGAGGFGMISIAFTVLTYGVMFSSAGLQMLGIRETAAGRREHIAGGIIGARIMLSLGAWIIIACIMAFIPNITQAALILIVAVSLLPNALFLDWYFQGREMMGTMVGGRLISAGIYLAVIFFLVHSSANLLLVGLGAVAGDCASALYLLTMYRRERVPLAITLKPGRWLPLLRSSLPLGMGSIFGTLSINFPPIAIGIFMTAADAGIYSAAARLVFFLLMLDRVLSQIILPVSTRLYASAPESLAVELERAIKWMALIALPAAIGGTILSSKIILLVYGSQFSGAAPLFRIAIWYFPVTLLNTIYTAGMIAVRQERRYGTIMMITAIIYGAGIIVGIMTAGTVGAIAAVVVAETVSTAMMSRALGRFLSIGLPRGIIRIFLASVVMAAILWLLPALPLFALVLIAGTIYLFQVFATRALEVRELAHLIGQTP